MQLHKHRAWLQDLRAQSPQCSEILHAVQQHEKSIIGVAVVVPGKIVENLLHNLSQQEQCLLETFRFVSGLRFFNIVDCYLLQQPCPVYRAGLGPWLNWAKIFKLPPADLARLMSARIFHRIDSLFRGDSVGQLLAYFSVRQPAEVPVLDVILTEVAVFAACGTWNRLVEL